jgi:hypothetical protein
MKVWRTLCSLLLCLCPCVVGAQNSLWRHFDEGPGPIPDNYIKAGLSSRQVASLRTLLVPLLRREDPCLEPDVSPKFDFRFSHVRLASTPVMRVEGSCGDSSYYFAGWMVAWSGPRPYLIAPSKDLYCWFGKVQRHTVNGFHDFTMGCHQSWEATDYAWYRFDGARYRRIATATKYERGDESRAQIATTRQWCKENHIYCFW